VYNIYICVCVYNICTQHNSRLVFVFFFRSDCPGAGRQWYIERDRGEIIYIYEYKVYVKKNVVWHAPSKTRCSGGLSYTHTCRIPAGNAAAVVITSYRIIYTYTAVHCRRTTAFLTNRFVHRPTISVFIRIGHFGFTAAHLAPFKVNEKKKN